MKKGIDYIGVSACAVIHDGAGRILLMKRSTGARDEHGRWDICGGAIDFGESTEEAIRREVKEELCTEPLRIEFLTVYDAHREIDGRQTHWVALIHAVQVDPDKVRIGEPHKFDEIAWFTSENLPAPLHSQFEKSFGPAKTAGFVR